MRPVVGITLGDGGRPGFHAMREDYVRSVEQADAVPVVLPGTFVPLRRWGPVGLRGSKAKRWESEGSWSRF